MEEILDRFFLRILFAIFTFVLLFIYKYFHYFLYPNGKKQLKKIFNPIANPPDTLHFLSRLLGIAFIFSTLEFNFYYSLWVGIFHIFTMGIITICLYLISVYLAESIILYKFDYVDEILKRENYSYSIISFTINICIALLIRQILSESENSLVILSMLWLYSIVIFGFSTKLFEFYSHYSFNKQLIQQNLGLSFSYSGYILGNTILISMAFDQDHYDIKSYSLRVILKLLLSAIILPLFVMILYKIFAIKRDKKSFYKLLDSDPKASIGIGLLEGTVYIGSALLTSMITHKINFGGIFPYL
ncbi:MAG: hypothetical protein H6621_04155 [Halobacteriovoraceae bacterium]|nr:hypothetical protein [Halobacteriovoraceae bacterium]MCB9094243.1 hypothetical protein [Halobacteriovoraceae bacterium]